jgi:hypothetical protein
MFNDISTSDYIKCCVTSWQWRQYVLPDHRKPRKNYAIKQSTTMWRQGLKHTCFPCTIFRVYGTLVFHTNCKWFGKLWNLPPDGLIIATPQFTVFIDHCNIHYKAMDSAYSCGITTPPVPRFRLHVCTFAMWFEPNAVQKCLDWKHNKLECTPNFALRITS